MTLTQIAKRLARDSIELLDSSSDLDEIVEACTDSLRPHALLVQDRGADLATSLQHRSVASVSINRLRYGTGVSVVPAGPEEDTFLLTMPLAGRGRLSYGGSEAVATRGGLYVVGPYESFHFDFDDDYDQLVVRLKRSRVEEISARMSGSSVPRRVDLPLWTGESPKSFLSVLGGAMALSGAMDGTAGERLSLQVEEILIESLLLPFAGLLASDTIGGTRSARGLLVDRAQEHMLEHLAEPLSLTTVATRCGVGLRSLQLAFRSELGTTPGAWLRGERLDRAYRMLKLTEPDATTVTEVALRHGFQHLGEFAAQFRARFGVSPSAVLHRR